MHRLGILICIIAFVSCKKEPTTWDTSNSAPLLRTSLDIYDLIADSLLETGDDDVVSLVYSNEIFRFGVDSLVEVEEDTIFNTFSIFPISEIQVNPEQQFFNQDESISFEQVDAALSRAIISTGNLKLTASSDIDGDLLFKVVIPEAKRNGESFEYEAIIPAGNLGDPGILMESTKMDGYDLNLTGSSGAAFNEIEIIYSLSVPDYEEQVTIFAANEVTMEITFEGLEVEFVEGYLGTEEFEFDEKSYFENIPELNEAIINLSEARLDLTISNGFGVDLQALIFSIGAENSNSGEQVDLSHSIIGSTINLGRAGYHQGVPEPSEKHYLLDQNNSNLIDLLELIPDSITISGRAELNPFGNISNYNDFASSKSEFSCNAQVEIPLRTSFSNLVLKDSSDVDWSDDNSEITRAVLYLHAESSFLASAQLDLLLLDESGHEILNLVDYLAEGQLPFIAGASSAHPGLTTLVFTLEEREIELIQSANKIYTELRFETTNYPEIVEIRSTDKIEILISTDVEAQLELE